MMSRTQQTILLVLALVTGLMLGNGFSLLYQLTPEPPRYRPPHPWRSIPLEDRTVQVGFIAPDTESLEKWITVKELVEEDFNQYLGSLGYKIEFELLMDDGEGRAGVHLEKVQGFKSMDINLVIGGFLEQQVNGSLRYINDNEMILLSPSSRSSQYEIGADSLYRLSVPEEYGNPVICEALQRTGADSIILVYPESRKVAPLRTVLVEKGVNVIGEVKSNPVNLSETFSQLEEISGGSGAGPNTVILFTFPDQLGFLVENWDNYPNVCGLRWVYGDEPVELFTDDSMNYPDNMDLTLVTLAPVMSERYISVSERYENMTGVPMDYQSACAYDAAYISAMSILQCQSRGGEDIVKVLPDVADRFFGVSGWTRLDENGDRKYCSYEIWSIKSSSDFTPSLMGRYDGVSDRYTWYDGVGP
ncbi:ABC transporter substrate-binding protein [Candidatus Bathyarchaeota archaeon]|nr:ABC transporter substrate-binding protein [Candidatus Bathyarchaeota archaeon]